MNFADETSLISSFAMLPAILLIIAFIFMILISVLVGVLGSRRESGFGWAFCASVIASPIIGLLIVLITDKLPQGERKTAPAGIIVGAIALLLYLVLFIVLGVFASRLIQYAVFP